MNVLSFLFFRYGSMTLSKNSGSFRQRKKFSSWQAYLEYFSCFSSGLQLRPVEDEGELGERRVGWSVA